MAEKGDWLKRSTQLFQFGHCRMSLLLTGGGGHRQRKFRPGQTTFLKELLHYLNTSLQQRCLIYHRC